MVKLVFLITNYSCNINMWVITSLSFGSKRLYTIQVFFSIVKRTI